MGLLNDWARHVIPGSWTLVNVYSIGGMVLVESLFFIPFAYLLIVGILDTLNPSLEDASRTAGAGVLTTLRRVALPLVTPGIAAASLLIFSLASEQFIVPVVIGLRARIPTLQYELYLSMVDSPSRPNYAAAIGCLLLVITIVGFFLNSRATRFQRRFITVTGKASAPKPVALGPWRHLTCGLAILYLLIAVAAPYGTLLLVSLMRYFTPEITPNLFTLQNYAQLASLGTTALALRNTFLYALLAATVTLGLSGGISYLVSRSESRWPRVIGFLAMLPLSGSRDQPRPRHSVGVPLHPDRRLRDAVDPVDRLRDPLHAPRHPRDQCQPDPDRPGIGAGRPGPRRRRRPGSRGHPRAARALPRSWPPGPSSSCRSRWRSA